MHTKKKNVLEKMSPWGAVEDAIRASKRRMSWHDLNRTGGVPAARRKDCCPVPFPERQGDDEK